MGKTDIRVRPARPSDSRDLWLWRNDPLTRAMSKQSEEVSWEGHETWLERTLADPAKALFIGEIDGQSIGMCRFDLDRDKGQCEVSINLNPTRRGQGLATGLLAAGLGACEPERHLVFVAQIRHTNMASRKCFAKNGFMLEAETADFGRYTLSR
ncbi:MAG: GNAT family N-acetyltransferase [Phenylobacterium zucineum]|nr:MAG: GNAT family N-acetyltransferase [Phenylobacterium zucineum]